MSPFGDAAAKPPPRWAERVGCVTLDRAGAITQISAELGRLFGYPLADLKGRPFAALFASGAVGRRLKRFFAATTPGEPRLHLALPGVTKTGGGIPVRVSVYRTGFEGPAAFVAFVEPMAEPRPEISDPGLGDWLGLTSRLLTEREERGRGLARRVHREFAQEVATAKLNLAMLRDIPSLADPTLQDRLSRIERGLAAAAVAAQRLCESLYPPGLEELGLASALRTLAGDVSEKTRVEVRIVSNGEAAGLAPERAILVFRMVEEAIWNAARHSGAQVVTVSDCSESNRVRVEVRDAGTGFSRANVAASAGGLTRMQALAKLANAYCKVDTDPGAGTTVTVEAATGGEGS